MKDFYLLINMVRIRLLEVLIVDMMLQVGSVWQTDPVYLTAPPPADRSHKVHLITWPSL